MAKVLGVAYETMYYRLKQMGHLVDGILETYVEETVIGDNPRFLVRYIGFNGTLIIN